MAIVPQRKKKKIEMVNNYAKGKGQKVNLLLSREADLSGIFDSAYQSGLDAEVKAEMAKIIKGYRWLINNLNVNTPAAFTDAEAEAEINAEIIQFEDNL